MLAVPAWLRGRETPRTTWKPAQGSDPQPRRERKLTAALETWTAVRRLHAGDAALGQTGTKTLELPSALRNVMY